MSETNFNEAIKRMQEMNSRSIYNQPQPEKPKSTKAPERAENLLPQGLNFPFLDNLKADSDLALILGILLLLLSEKADKRLLFALIYILL